jgi:hypothetical protein
MYLQLEGRYKHKRDAKVKCQICVNSTGALFTYL